MPEVATRPPSGVGRNALWNMLQKKDKALDRIRRIDKQTVERTTDTVMRVGVGGGTAIATGALFAKFPKAAKIANKVDTLLVGGFLFTALGAGLRIQGNEWGSAVLAVGEGMLYPWLFQKGGELGAQLG